MYCPARPPKVGLEGVKYLTVLEDLSLPAIEFYFATLVFWFLSLRFLGPKHARPFAAYGWVHILFYTNTSKIVVCIFQGRGLLKGRPIVRDCPSGIVTSTGLGFSSSPAFPRRWIKCWVYLKGIFNSQREIDPL